MHTTKARAFTHASLLIACCSWLNGNIIQWQQQYRWWSGLPHLLSSYNVANDHLHRQPPPLPRNSVCTVRHYFWIYSLRQAGGHSIASRYAYIRQALCILDSCLWGPRSQDLYSVKCHIFVQGDCPYGVDEAYAGTQVPASYYVRNVVLVVHETGYSHSPEKRKLQDKQLHRWVDTDSNSSQKQEMRAWMKYEFQCRLRPWMWRSGQYWLSKFLAQCRAKIIWGIKKGSITLKQQKAQNPRLSCYVYRNSEIRAKIDWPGQESISDRLHVQPPWGAFAPLASLSADSIP